MFVALLPSITLGKLKVSPVDKQYCSIWTFPAPNQNQSVLPMLGLQQIQVCASQLFHHKSFCIKLLPSGTTCQLISVLSQMGTHQSYVHVCMGFFFNPGEPMGSEPTPLG